MWNGFRVVFFLKQVWAKKHTIFSFKSFPPQCCHCTCWENDSLLMRYNWTAFKNSVFKKRIRPCCVESILRKRENGFQKCIMCIGSYSTCVLHGIVQSQDSLKSINKQIEKYVDREIAAKEIVVKALLACASDEPIWYLHVCLTNIYSKIWLIWYTNSKERRLMWLGLRGYIQRPQLIIW